ncbi:MAG: hypothetical protein ACREL5_09435 [Gemmatimonadales bacterium]
MGVVIRPGERVLAAATLITVASLHVKPLHAQQLRDSLAGRMVAAVLAQSFKDSAGYQPHRLRSFDEVAALFRQCWSGEAASCALADSSRLFVLDSVHSTGKASAVVSITEYGYARTTPVDFGFTHDLWNVICDNRRCTVRAWSRMIETGDGYIKPL